MATSAVMRKSGLQSAFDSSNSSEGAPRRRISQRFVKYSSVSDVLVTFAKLSRQESSNYNRLKKMLDEADSRLEKVRSRR